MTTSSFLRAARFESLIALVFLGAAGCSGSSGPPLTSSQLAIAGLNAAYVDHDDGAIDTYFADNFIRHDPAATADGTAAFKAQLATAPQGRTWKSHRVFEAGDLAVVHDEYLDAGGATKISFDLFRVAGGKIAEHWTCAQTDPGTYASGHTMTDGPTALDPTANSAASADLVVTPGKGFVPIVIEGGAFMRVADFLTPTFAQHDPLIADGLMGLGAGFSQPPLNTLMVRDVPESLAENDFVFTRSKSTMTWDALKAGAVDNPTVTCDLFHVQGGKITEHWDVIQMDPNGTSIDRVGKNGAGHSLWD